MSYFDTKDKKRGAIGTIGVHLIILVLFAIYGLTYPDPRPEIGLPINFGTSNQGSGEIEPEVSGTPPQEVTPPTPTEPTEQAVTTQDIEQTIEVPPSDNEAPVKPKETPVEQPKEETKPVEETKPKEEPKPQLDKKLDNMLKSDLFKKAGGSQGDDNNKAGNKGKIDGKGGNNYSGTQGGGGGGNGNYSLGNRQALLQVEPEYECDEYGIVKMQVRVNRKGETVSAKVHLKGTENTAPCLVNRAKEAAMKTRWQGDPSAPEIQVGYITYHFELN